VSERIHTAAGDFRVPFFVDEDAEDAVDDPERFDDVWDYVPMPERGLVGPAAEPGSPERPARGLPVPE